MFVYQRVYQWEYLQQINGWGWTNEGCMAVRNLLGPQFRVAKLVELTRLTVWFMIVAVLTNLLDGILNQQTWLRPHIVSQLVKFSGKQLFTSTDENKWNNLHGEKKLSMNKTWVRKKLFMNELFNGCWVA